jgi:hypothetical protein
MGKTRKTKEEWVSEMQKTWALATNGNCSAKKPISKWCFDVLAVTVQEDFRGSKYGQFPDAIGIFLGPDEWEIHSSVVKGPPDILNRPFTVKMYVYVNKASMVPGTTFTTAGLCLQKQIKMFCSKGTAGVAMNVPNKGQVILMGSHFPIKTDQTDMGVAIRKSINGVFNRLRSPQSPNVVAIWGGDMNFRRNTAVTTSANQTIWVNDQLNYARNQGAFNVNAQQRFEEQPILFPPTCKLHACIKNDCPVCRLETDRSDAAKEECYDKTRTPSHCDRILFFVSGQNVTLQPKGYKSWADGSIKFSDHNLVWADFDLHW